MKVNKLLIHLLEAKFEADAALARGHGLQQSPRDRDQEQAPR